MTAESAQVTEPRRSWLGVAIILATLAVAVLATVVGVIVLDNALGGRIRDRTVWGVVVMVVGAAGPIVALLVVVGRRHILRQSARRQWVGLALFPGSFVALWVFAFLAYGTLNDRSTTPIIPHTTKFIVRFDRAGQPSFVVEGDIRGSEERRGELRVDGKPVGDISFDYRVLPEADGKTPVAIEGAVKPPAERRLELRGVLILEQKVRMRVEGLKDATLTINDQQREFPVDLEPGRYQVVIHGESRE
jgi:hypothetical protein